MLLRRHGNMLFVACPAKLNLFLELLGKRDDGFHQIETVMTTVSLFDELRFTATSGADEALSLDVRLVSQGPSRERDVIPSDGRNLIVRALDILRTQAIQQGRCLPDVGMRVSLAKRIPSAAGLGGASSNAAAALIAGNLLWSLGYSDEELAQFAASLGSDIAFFIGHSLALCTGRGEQVKSVSSRLGPIDLVIVKPIVSLSTRDVYQQVSHGSAESRFDSPEIRSSQPLLQGLASGRPAMVASQIWNRLELAASQLTDELVPVRQQFESLPCLGHMMSGSGSSYFGIFNSRRSARVAAGRLKAKFSDARIFCVRSLAGVGQRRKWEPTDRLVS